MLVYKLYLLTYLLTKIKILCMSFYNEVLNYGANLSHKRTLCAATVIREWCKRSEIQSASASIIWSVGDSCVVKAAEYWKFLWNFLWRIVDKQAAWGCSAINQLWVYDLSVKESHFLYSSLPPLIYSRELFHSLTTECKNLVNYSAPDRSAEYCDERVCLCVCLSVRDHIFETTVPIFN